MNLLILTLDRWNWAFAEPLGNRWIRTPVLNRLAAMGTVFNQCYATSSDGLTTWRTLLDPFRVKKDATTLPSVERRSLSRPVVATLSREFGIAGIQSVPTTQTPGDAAHECSTASLDSLLDSLPQQLARRGWRTRLLTDSESFTQSNIGFETVESMRSSPQPPNPANSTGSIDPVNSVDSMGAGVPRCAKLLEETELFREFSCLHETLETLSEASEPFFLAAHFESLARIWDAPYEFRASYVEGDDPDPGDGAAVPPLPLLPSADPDVRLAVHQAYAGQISLFDTLLEPLVDWLNESESGRNTAILLMGVRGVSCHEGTAPPDSPPGTPIRDASDGGLPRDSNGKTALWESETSLSADQVHLPVLLRLPQNAAKWTRSASLVTPEDLHIILRILTQLDIPESITERTFIPDEPFPERFDVDHVRDRILITGRGEERSLLTDHWYLRHIPDQPPQLFLRRDDPFQANDVSSRCRAIVEALTALLALPQTTPLPEIVTQEPN